MPRKKKAKEPEAVAEAPAVRLMTELEEQRLKVLVEEHNAAVQSMTPAQMRACSRTAAMAMVSLSTNTSYMMKTGQALGVPILPNDVALMVAIFGEAVGLSVDQMIDSIFSDLDKFLKFVEGMKEGLEEFDKGTV